MAIKPHSEFRTCSGGVFIHCEPTQPGMPRMLWVLPELAPVKSSSIPGGISVTASDEDILKHLVWASFIVRNIFYCIQISRWDVEVCVIVI